MKWFRNVKLILALCGTVVTVACMNITQETEGDCKIVNMANMTKPSRQYFADGCYSVICDHLEEVPKDYPDPLTNKSLCFLDLSWNNFDQLENSAFVNANNLNSTSIQNLYLDNSNISYISSNAFLGLTGLLYLNLSGNNLTWPDGFGKGVFKPLSSLQYLNVKENHISTFIDLGIELVYMRNLTGIFAELCDNCKFGKEFEQLEHLVNMSLSGRSKDACNVTTIHNDTFEGLTKLERLWLSSCNIKNIEANAFNPLNDSLFLLDISYNEDLKFEGMNTALYGLRKSTSLQIINVNRIHDVYNIGVEVKKCHLENLSSLRALTTLHMDLNKIEIFEKEIFNPMSVFPSSLRDLTLSGNRLSFGIYTEDIYRAVNITCLDISRQHLYYDPFMFEHFEPENTLDDSKAVLNKCMLHQPQDLSNNECTKNCSFCLPPNLRRVKWRKSFLNIHTDMSLNICGATHLEHLDLSFNLLTKWKSSIKGLENLKHLDLSENYCSEVAPAFFDNFRQLKHLNISGNNLGVPFRHHHPSSNLSNKIFRNLTQITDLDLSCNRIERFADRQIFKDLKNIQFMRLHSNLLGDWKYKMPNSKSLKLLDLSGNKFISLSEKLRQYLDKCTYCNVSLNLKYNPLECSCKTLPFLKWIVSTKVHVQTDECRFNAEQVDISDNGALQTVIETLEKKECVDKSWLTWTVGLICVIVGCLLSIVIGVAVYRYRWKLRYLYYSRNRRYNHKGFERLFENDAFVSYSKCKASFIKSNMVPSLEQQRGLRLWAADRNSIPGTSIAENITHGIYNSRKSVLLIDTDYLKDSWCDYEMNMVHVESTETKRKLIIIVLMENIPLENLPISVMRFLRSERSLEYPEHGHDLDTFWTNLADEIMT